MEPKQLRLKLDGPEEDSELVFSDEAPEPERAEEKPKLGAGEFVNAQGVIVTDDDIPF